MTLIETRTDHNTNVKERLRVDGKARLGMPPQIAGATGFTGRHDGNLLMEKATCLV